MNNDGRKAEVSSVAVRARIRVEGSIRIRVGIGII